MSALIAALTVLVPVSAGLLPASAFGTVGAQLGSFFPNPDRNGRGIAITGSTAYITGQDSPMYVVNLATHETTAEVSISEVQGGAGALTFDSSGQLWGSEYLNSSKPGEIARINKETGTREEVFDAHAVNEEDKRLSQIDGLGADGKTFWVKGDGVGGGPLTVYHVSAEGKKLGSCEVPFGNSGIAVQGNYLWLADNEGHAIHRYEKTNNGEGPEACKDTGLSFSTGSTGGEGIEPTPVGPEGLALDHCTFPGHLALWTYGSAAGDAGPLVAYDLGPDSETTGCPVPLKKEKTKEETKTTSTSTPELKASAPGGVVLAGGSLLLEGSAPADPTGLLFVYIWNFGDGTGVKGHGRVRHTYKCAGIYHVSVTDIDTSGARHESTGELGVGFPRRDNKSYRGLHFSPHVRVSGHKANLWLSWSGKGKHVSARSVDWKLDRQSGRHFPIHNHAEGTVSLGRNHHMSATTHFSNGHTITIRACFHA